MASEENSGIRSVLGWLRSRLAPNAAGVSPQFNAPASPASSVSSATPDAFLSGLDPAALLAFARAVPLVYGRWREFKYLYKQTEAQIAEAPDAAELFGALIGRLDATPLTPAKAIPEPFSDTKGSSYSPSLAVSGNRAYIVTFRHQESALFVFDVSDPVTPALLGTLKIPFARKIVVEGERAYVITQRQYGGKSRLCVVDIADPRKPRLSGWIEIANPQGIAVEDGRVWVTSGREYDRGRWQSAALHAIDVSAPTRPQSVGKIEIENAADVSVFKGQAVVLCCLDGYYYSRPTETPLTLVDVANPSRMRVVATLQMENANALTRMDNAILVTVTKNNPYFYGSDSPNAQAGLHVFDVFTPPNLFNISNPSSLVRVAYLPLGQANFVSVQGTLAFVARERGGEAGKDDFDPGGLSVIDLADPKSPREIARQTAKPLFDVVAGGGYVFTAMEGASRWERILRVWDVSEPTRPLLTGALPSRRTMGYMKRRARRALRTLAQTNPDAWMQAAVSALLVSGAGREAVDPFSDWISMDLLFGGSPQWEQTAHGRGAYKQAGARFVFRTREERNPGLWNRNPDALAPLLTTPGLPVQTYAFAVNVLHDLKRPLPNLPDAVWTRFLHSGLPLLTTLATRHLTAEFEAGNPVAPEAAASVFILGNGRLRRRFEAALVSRLHALLTANALPGEWATQFTAQLLQTASAEMATRAQKRRQAAAIQLLADRFPQQLARTMDVALAFRLYASGRDQLTAIALDFVRGAPFSVALPWLQLIESLPPTQREPALTALFAGMADKAFPADNDDTAISADSAWVREQGWRLLEASATPMEVARAAWRHLLSEPSVTPPLQTALESPAALRLLERAEFAPELLTELIETRPFLVGVLSPGALAVFVRSLTPTALVQLVAGAPDNRWLDLRGALSNALDSAAKRQSFWSAAFAVLDDGSILYARLVNDAEMRGTFRHIADISDFLKSGNPATGEILRAWLTAHETSLGRDSNQLLLAATHPLPAVRDWALARAETLGFGLAFALRLLESELPPAIAVGQGFFESVPADDPRSLEYAVALADSPHKATRAYGRQYANQRWNDLPHESLLARLAENPDPASQAWVAERGLEEPAALAGVAPQFDRDVLRARDRSRKAKELVKRRISAQPTENAPDLPTLLEMARSRTPRDSEWAMQQLARLALEGREIDGVTVG